MADEVISWHFPRTEKVINCEKFCVGRLRGFRLQAVRLMGSTVVNCHNLYLLTCDKPSAYRVTLCSWQYFSCITDMLLACYWCFFCRNTTGSCQDSRRWSQGTARSRQWFLQKRTLWCILQDSRFVYVAISLLIRVMYRVSEFHVAVVAWNLCYSICCIRAWKAVDHIAIQFNCNFWAVFKASYFKRTCEYFNKLCELEVI